MPLTKVRGKGLGTLGDGTASDYAIVFDGNAQDFHIGLDDSTDSLTMGLGSTLGTTTHMRFDPTGAVTKPLNPCFLSSGTLPSSGEISTGVSNMTFLNIGTERFDKNNDYDGSTGVFTAPVAGVYKFYIQVFYTSEQTNGHLALSVNGDTAGGGGGYVSNNAWVVRTTNNIEGSWLVNLSANDTARPILHGNPDTINNSHLRQFFHGYLVA